MNGWMVNQPSKLGFAHRNLTKRPPSKRKFNPGKKNCGKSHSDRLLVQAKLVTLEVSSPRWRFQVLHFSHHLNHILNSSVPACEAETLDLGKPKAALLPRWAVRIFSKQLPMGSAETIQRPALIGCFPIGILPLDETGKVRPQMRIPGVQRQKPGDRIEGAAFQKGVAVRCAHAGA